MKQFLWMIALGLLFTPVGAYAGMMLLPRVIPYDPLSETGAVLAFLGLMGGGFLGFIIGGMIGVYLAERGQDVGPE